MVFEEMDGRSGIQVFVISKEKSTTHIQMLNMPKVDSLTD